MKKLFLLGFAIILCTACEQTEKRYTMQSPEIDSFKQVIDTYQKQDWATYKSHYADTAKIMSNTTQEFAKTIDQEIAQNKKDASLFHSWKYNPEDVEYEMVITDEGETWVNFWGDWRARLKENDKEYIIPVHITARFLNDKIDKFQNNKA